MEKQYISKEITEAANAIITKIKLNLYKYFFKVTVLFSQKEDAINQNAMAVYIRCLIPLYKFPEKLHKIDIQ